MKRCISLIILSQLSGAFACIDLENRSELITVCTGDKAFTADGNRAETGDGVIVGLNPNSRKVSINFDRGTTRFGGIGTYNLDRVTFGKGCYAGACVGDRGIKQNGGSASSGDGIIVGINPVSERVSINFNFGTSRYGGIGTYDLNDITIGKGCFAGVCVGDLAFVQNGRRAETGDGIVIGVNPVNGKVSVDFNRGTSRFGGIGTYNVTDVTVGEYCVAYGAEAQVRYTMDKFEFYENFSE